MLLDILIIILLILGNSFLALAELSIIFSKSARLQVLAEGGNKDALNALGMSKKPNRIIATSQIGLTFLTLVEGAVIDNALTPHLSPYLMKIQYLANYSHTISLILSFTVVTTLTILFGDILPKRIAIAYPEKIAVTLLPMVTVVVWLLNPFITIFTVLSDYVLKFFKIPTERNTKVSAEDIEDLLQAGAESGLLNKTEKHLLDNVWRMDEVSVGAVMTPRNDIVYIDLTKNYQENLQTVLNAKTRRIIICSGGLDKIIGSGKSVIWLKEIVKEYANGNINYQVDWLQHMTPTHNVPNSLSLIEALNSLYTHQSFFALVYNEFGHIEGLISMTNLMFAIVGGSPEIKAENIAIIKDATNNKWVIHGMTPMDDVIKTLHIKVKKSHHNNTYNTAAGFALTILGRNNGRLPQEGDKFIYAGYSFEILDIDRTSGYRINRLTAHLEQHKQ